MTEVQNIREVMLRERICVLVPTYNNAGTIADVLRRVGKYTDSIIVVNDGCTDDTVKQVEKSGVKLCTVVSYTPNRGKGYALMAGFRAALREGYSYAITIDSDAQHFPEDLPRFIDTFLQHRGALIVGARNLNEDNMPRKNTFANKFSNFWFYLQTGIHLEDTQTGYRLYPLSQISNKWVVTYRYESELELLVYIAWKGVEVVSVPVRVYYPPAGERVTHFRPFWDFMRITLLNTWLTTAAFCYYIPVRWLRRIFH